MTPRPVLRGLFMVATASTLTVAWALPASGQENSAPPADICGITPQSARDIAREIIRQTGDPYDSISPAYYVSVLAARLSPYYVVYFIKDSLLVGVVEIDMCGRMGTPHPGLRYVAESDLRFDRLILEPDEAFRILRSQVGAEPAFATRVFPFGLVQDQEILSAIEFWWLILDTGGRWHYMNRLGEMVGVTSQSGGD